MQNIDISGLKEWDQSLTRMLKDFPEERRALHERMSELAKRTLDDAISTSGLNDRRGAVRRWQVAHVGSGGGYAAVRPKGSKEGGSVGPNSEGAITNYLEGGHALPPPARSGRRRVTLPRVRGRYFYRAASATFEAQAIGEAERFADELVRRLEGGG